MGAQSGQFNMFVSKKEVVFEMSLENQKMYFFCKVRREEKGRAFQIIN